jgi:hypothetical protein
MNRRKLAAFAPAAAFLAIAGSEHFRYLHIFTTTYHAALALPDP